MQPLKIGLIGGSGLGEALSARETGTPQYVNTPFGQPSTTIIETTWAGLPVLVLQRHGKGHIFNPSAVPYRANIYALKMLGCTHILASGAVGSLREEFRPRDLVVPDQIIDKTHKRPNTFFESAAVHVEFAEPFCPNLRSVIRKAGEAVDLGPAVTAEHAVSTPPAAGAPAPQTPRPPRINHGGCYVAMEGPAFSTRAESLMHRLWGGDLVGMTAMPEAKLAKEAEIPYALISLVTDYDCWRAKPAERPHDPHELLNEIIGNLKAATENAIALMKATVERIAAEPQALNDCPATRALELGIWSSKSQIPPEEIERLEPLWGKYFPK